MKTLTAIFLFTLSTVSFAQVRELAPFKKQLEIHRSDRPKNIWIMSARKANIPTKVEEVPSRSCRVSDTDTDCTVTRVRESAPGYILDVQYEIFVGRGGDSDNLVRDTLYVSEQDVRETATLGRYLNARKANRVFTLTTTTETRNIRTIDYRRSRFCGDGEFRCEDEIVYRPATVELIIVKPAVK